MLISFDDDGVEIDSAARVFAVFPQRHGKSRSFRPSHTYHLIFPTSTTTWLDFFNQDSGKTYEVIYPDDIEQYVYDMLHRERARQTLNLVVCDSPIPWVRQRGDSWNSHGEICIDWDTFGKRTRGSFRDFTGVVLLIGGMWQRTFYADQIEACRRNLRDEVIMEVVCTK